MTEWGLGALWFDNGYAWGITEKGSTICLGKEHTVKGAISDPDIKSGIYEIDQIIELERQLAGINKKDGVINGKIRARATGATVKRRTINASDSRGRLMLHARNRAPGVRRVAKKGISNRVSQPKLQGLLNPGSKRLVIQ